MEMTPHQRFMELKSRGYCFQCLFPGALISYEKHKEGKCQRDFACKHPARNRFSTKKHVLVCEEHKDNLQNKELLQQYKDRCILSQRIVELPTYSKEIKLSFHLSQKENTQRRVEFVVNQTEDVIVDKGIYQLQTIKVGSKCYTLFFDSGCGDFVSRHGAITRISDNPVNLGASVG